MPVTINNNTSTDETLLTRVSTLETKIKSPNVDHITIDKKEVIDISTFSTAPTIPYIMDESWGLNLFQMEIGNNDGAGKFSNSISAGLTIELKASGGASFPVPAGEYYFVVYGMQPGDSFKSSSPKMAGTASNVLTIGTVQVWKFNVTTNTTATQLYLSFNNVSLTEKYFYICKEDPRVEVAKVANKTLQSVNASTTLGNESKLISVDSSSGELTLTLPIVTSEDTGKSIIILPDENADINPITMDGNGKVINGYSSYSILEERGAKEFYFDGNGWRIISGFENIFYIENNEIYPRNGLPLNANSIVGNSGTNFTFTTGNGILNLGDFHSADNKLIYNENGFINSKEIVGADKLDSITSSEISGTVTNASNILVDGSDTNGWLGAELIVDFLSTTPVDRINMNLLGIMTTVTFDIDGSVDGTSAFTNIGRFTLNCSGNLSVYEDNDIDFQATQNYQRYKIKYISHSGPSNGTLNSSIINFFESAFVTDTNFLHTEISGSTVQLSAPTLTIKDENNAVIPDSNYNVKYSTNGGLSFSTVYSPSTFRTLGLLAPSNNYRIAVQPIGAQKISNLSINTAQIVSKVTDLGFEVIINGQSKFCVGQDGIVTSQANYSNQIEIVNAATMTFDLNSGDNQTTASPVDQNTIFEIDNALPGRKFRFEIEIDATGGYTLTLGTSLGNVIAGELSTLNTAASSLNIIEGFVSKSGNVFYKVTHV